MNSEKRTTRGRGRGRARGRARGRGRGRGKKVPKVMSSDEECSVEEASQEPAEPVTEEPKEVREEPVEPAKLEVPSDISQLEAPVFTTLTRGPPEPMLRLDWSHRATLIGEKVLNPMIYCCDTCIKPILIYGRMIPCKHVFCLSCARSDHTHCPRCREKVLRVEQTGLGTVFMCTHSGTRYGNTGCRRTYLSQRDLQAHINHRHVSSGADSKQEDAPSVASLSVKPITLPPSANDPRAHAQHGGGAERPRARTNLITVPIQETDSHYYNYSYPPPPQPVPPPAACSVSVLHSMNVPPPYYASAYSAPPNTYLQPGTNMTPNVSGVAPLPAPTLSAPLGAPLEGARWPYPAGGTPWAQHYYR